MSKYAYKQVGNLVVGDTIHHRGEDITITEIVKHSESSISYYWQESEQRHCWNDHPTTQLPVKQKE